MIDCIAGEHQYLNHLLPIWNALPDGIRGDLYITTMLAKRCADEGLDAIQRRPPNSTNLTLVASYGDYRSARDRPVIFVEHGAGQQYLETADHPAYSGGKGRERAVLFICPSEVVAARNRVTYPHIPAVAVGCPALDRYHPILPPLNPLTVAITFHSDIRIAPESASSFREFHTALPLLIDAGFDVLGHAHPRLCRRLKPFYDKAGIRSTGSLDVVMEEAAVMVADNTSAAFEFATLSRPIVWMTPTFYRRDITAWPRFWDALILGEEATTPDELPAAVTRALEPVSLDTQTDRDKFLDTVYAYRDGTSTHRAVDAILEVL